MYFLADTANPQEIKKALEIYPLRGITTNPTLLSREGKKLSVIIPDLQKLLKGKMLHLQLISVRAEEMVKEAIKYKEHFRLNENFFAKIPITSEGLRAIPKIKSAGISVTATAVYTPMQAELAAQAGADFVVPYINRLDNMSADSEDVISQMAEIFDRSEDHDCQILAASFKNTQQVVRAALAGAHAVTLSINVLESLINHNMVDKAVEDFNRDGKSFYDIKP